MARKRSKLEIVSTHIVLAIFSILAVFPILWILIASFTPRYDIPGLSGKIISRVTFESEPGAKYFKEVEQSYKDYRREYRSILRSLKLINRELRGIVVKESGLNSSFVELERIRSGLEEGFASFTAYRISRAKLNREIEQELKSSQTISPRLEGELKRLDSELKSLIGPAESLAKALAGAANLLSDVELKAQGEGAEARDPVLESLKESYIEYKYRAEEITGVSPFNNYISLLSEQNFLHWFLNSVLVAIFSTLAGLVFSSTAAFAFSQFRFAGRKALLYGFLFTQMFPGALLIVALYNIMNRLGLLNSLIGLIVAYSTFSLPFCVWMLKSYFDTIPTSLMEAGKIDGLSYWGQFYRIGLPLALPGIAVTCFFSFITAWNEFLFALIFLTSDKKMTLAVGLRTFIGYENTMWDHLSAGSILITLPVLIFFVFAQRWIISGLTKGAVKG